MTRRIATILILAALVAAVPASAQETQFFIERIDVHNAERVSPDVVIAESRLREGESYSEADLRDAAARLARLPFLLAADFALAKGSERGRYVLVITVTETRSFFYRLEFVPIVEKGPNSQIGISSQIDAGDETSATLGYRWFLGRRGSLHVALIGRDSTEFTRGYGAFAVGWTQYDLFGTRGFATLNIKDSPDTGTSPQLVVGMPLSLNQTVTAEYDELVVDYDTAIDIGLDDRDSQRVARVTWSYNTTNHPYLPTDGTLFSVGPVATWRDESSTFVIAVGDVPSFQNVPSHTTIYGVEASAQRYWEITDRNSVSLGVETRVGHFDQRYTRDTQRRSNSFNSLSGLAQAGFSRSLWSPERRAQGGDSRLEVSLRARVRDNNVVEDGRLLRFDDDVVQASVSWLRHSSWGTLRLGAGVAW